MGRLRRLYWTNKQISDLSGIKETTLRRWNHRYKLSAKGKYDRDTVAKIIKFHRIFSRKNVIKLKDRWMDGKIKII